MSDIPTRFSELIKSMGRPVRLMEVCGTHTVAIFRHGIRSMLPAGVHLLSGPGCPVCVTSVGDIEAAIRLAETPGVILATFGDMMRVPGIKRSLGEAKADGCDIRVVYSPLDALQMAESTPDRSVVFLATGFETTSPLVAATLSEAERTGVLNFFIQSVHKLVPPALEALLTDEAVRVDGFILPGHVTTVIGLAPYAFLAERYGRPGVVTGFEAPDILAGILMLLEQLAAGTATIANEYSRVVHDEGNPRAVSMLYEYFEPADADWRGIGILPGSGLLLKEAYRHRDALQHFGLSVDHVEVPSACQCGDVLKGIKIPTDCKLFGKACVPERPVGPCMVSTEGSCAAYFKYGGT